MTQKVTELLENASECEVSGVFENSILKKIPTEQCISTGITLLNLNLSGNKDGGFRKGSLVQLLAETGVGKTLFGSYVMKTAIENPAFKNYKMRFIDKEGGFNIEYPKEIQDRIETYNSINCPSLSTIERTLIMICNWLDEGVPMIICLDSTNAFISQNMLENLKANSKVVSKDTEDKQGELKEDMMGQVAKAMSKYMPIVKEKLDRTGSLMLIMSQYRDKIGAGMFDEKVYTSGGKAIEYSCDYRLQFKKGSKITQVTSSGRKVDAGCIVNITVKKTRGNGLHLTCAIPFKDGIGFSDIQAMFNYLKETKVIEQKGAYCVFPAIFGEDKKFEKDMRKAIGTNPEYLEKMKAESEKVWWEEQESIYDPF